MSKPDSEFTDAVKYLRDGRGERLAQLCPKCGASAGFMPRCVLPGCPKWFAEIAATRGILTPEKPAKSARGRLTGKLRFYRFGPLYVVVGAGFAFGWGKAMANYIIRQGS